MSSYCSGLKIAHFNAGSFSAHKADYARFVFENSQVDVLCLTETWLHTNLNDFKFLSGGYKLFRNDKSNKKGGGVAVYCKEQYKSRVIDSVKTLDLFHIFGDCRSSITKGKIIKLFEKSNAAKTIVSILRQFITL